MANELAQRERRLEELEDIIEQGFETFIEVGNAIAEIHSDELYLERGYTSFSDYMERRWGWTRDQGYKRIRAARVVGILSNGDVYRGIRPTAERQVRPLTYTELSEEQIIDAWEEAVYLANEERGLLDTPEQWAPPYERHVRYVVNEILSDRRRRKPRKLVELGKFNIIYADPPWRYDYSFSNSRAVERFYQTMTMEDLFDMADDLKGVAAEDSLLFMWCPPAFTRKAVILMRVWGFDYRTNLVWVKPSIGAGQWVRQQHELLLLGRRGSFPTADGPLRPPSIVQDSRKEHSEKPKAFYELIEQMYPDVPKLELFGREQRDGWEVWGNEI